MNQLWTARRVYLENGEISYAVFNFFGDLRMQFVLKPIPD